MNNLIDLKEYSNNRIAMIEEKINKARNDYLKYELTGRIKELKDLLKEVFENG